MGYRGSPPPGGRNPAQLLGTEILRWSDRRKPAEALLRPRGSLVTPPCHQADRIVEQGRSRESKSPVGSHGSADLVSNALAALRTGRSAGERTGTDRDLTKGTGARSHAMSAHGARNPRRQSSIGGPMGCANSSDRQSESPPSLSWFCRIGTAAGRRRWCSHSSRGAPTVVQPIRPSRTAISGVMKGLMIQS
jgi:hypothetical protein